MDDIEYYKKNINQIFTCLNQLDTYLEDQDNSSLINSLNEYKNELIAFSQLFTSNASDNSSSEVGDSK
ncbi:MAG: hypothetical protein IK997_02335 [Bacilli bacterium]|nr:hypothetical protein [Bacilli bacterium]